MKNHPIEELQKSINFNRSEIKRLEGEFDFLLGEIHRMNEMHMASMTKKIIDDPEFERLLGPTLGENFVKETRLETQEVLDGVEINKEELKSSLIKMTDVLISLHEKQINNYSKLSIESDKVKMGEYLDDPYSKEMFKESVKDSIKSYRNMIKFYLDSKERFLNLIK